MCVVCAWGGGLFLINLSFPEATQELPAAKTCPNITSETSSGATAALFKTSLMTAEPRSWTGTVDKAPLNEPATELWREQTSEPWAHCRSPPRAAGLQQPEPGRWAPFGKTTEGVDAAPCRPNKSSRRSGGPRALKTRQHEGGGGYDSSWSLFPTAPLSARTQTTSGPAPTTTS